MPRLTKRSKPANAVAEAAVPGTEGWRMPPPLAPFVSGDVHLDRLVAGLRLGLYPSHFPPEVAAILTEPNAWQRGQLELLLDQPGLDVGECTWDQAFSAQLERRELKAYTKRYEAILSEQNNRLHTLTWVADILARDRSTEGRVLDLALHHPNATLRGRVAFGSLLEHGSPAALSALTAALDATGETANPDVRMAATVAVLRTTSDPAAVFDRLAPWLERSHGGGEADISHAIQVAVGLKALPPKADPRWRGVLARLLSHPRLQLYALFLYERVDLDAGMEDALLAFTDLQLAIPSFNRSLIDALGRCKDRRAALLLARGFQFNANEARLLFEKLRAFDVAAAAPLLRASVAAVRKVRKDDNPHYEEAGQLCAWLERNGAASTEEQQALAKMPAPLV